MTKLFQDKVIRNFLKHLIVLFLLLWNFNIYGQTCNNPEARLRKLKSKTVTTDTIFKWINKDLDILNLQAGDTVADIGSYDGYYPTLYSIYNDSITFYLNDIRKEGFLYLDSIRQAVENISGNKVSNEFNIVIGNDSSTNLQANSFNKVIIRDALHHFHSVEKMLQEIIKIMEPESELMLIEPIRGQNNIYSVCEGAMTEEELLNLLFNNGFELIKKTKGQKSLGWYKFKLKPK